MRRRRPTAVGLPVNTGLVTIRKVGLAARLSQGREAGPAGGAAAIGGPQDCALALPGEPIARTAARGRAVEILLGPARQL
jgi:hypothetical protein